MEVEYRGVVETGQGVGIPPRSLDLYTGQVPTEKEPGTGRSSLDRPHTRSTLILFPDGDAQITGMHFFPDIGNEVKVAESEEDKARRAAGRASARVHAMAKFHDHDHLWTINARGGIHSYDDDDDPLSVVRVVAKFKRAIQEEAKVNEEFENFKAVFVPELHTGDGVNRGMYHVHFGVHGFWDVKDLRRLLYQVGGFDDQGRPRLQIDVSRSHVNGNSHEAVASYISGYISKNIFGGVRQKYQRYYFMTKNCRLPRSNFKPDYWRKTNSRPDPGVVVVGRDFRGLTEERERRLAGLIFVATGKVARLVWKSKDGLNFRMATFGKVRQQC